MTSEHNKSIARAFFAAGNAGDVAACLELVDEDVTWTNIGSTRLSGTYRGKQALVDELLGPLFARLEAGIRSTVDRVIAEGDHVVVQSRGEASTRDGTAYNNTYCHVFRIRDGRIVAVTEYMDTALTARVFGADEP